MTDNFERYMPVRREKGKALFLNMTTHGLVGGKDLGLLNLEEKRYEIYFDRKNKRIKLIRRTSNSGTFKAMPVTGRPGAAKFNMGTERTGMPPGRYFLRHETGQWYDSEMVFEHMNTKYQRLIGKDGKRVFKPKEKEEKL